MKALPKELLSLTLFGIAVTSLFSVRPAQAFTVRVHQVGSNVVATGSGAINLTGLTFLGSFSQTLNPFISPTDSTIFTGLGGFQNLSAFSGFTGQSFGSGGMSLASAGNGDFVGINSVNIDLPQGYVSGAALSSSATWNNATIASLGLTPGIYVDTWGTGLPNQNFTLRIGSVGVPDGGATVSLFGCALIGLAVLRRKLTC